MTILVCGAEGDWALFENTLDPLGADDKRRGSVRVNTGQQMFKEWVGTDDIWVHVRAAGPRTTSNTGDGLPWLSVRASDGTTLLSLVDANIDFSTNRPSQIYRRKRVADAETPNAEIFTSAPNEFNNYDIRFQRATTTDLYDTMTMSVYIDEVLRFQEVNTDPTGWPPLSQLLLAPRHTNGSHDEMYYQDVIVTDSLPTVGMELATLVPSAVGQYNEFVNDYTNIDDLGYDQSTVISAPTSGIRESWVFATPEFDLSDKVIYGLVTNTVAQTDVAGVVGDFQPFIRIGITDYDADVSLGSNNIAPNSYVTEYRINPETGQPWTQLQLSGLQSGVRAV